MRAADAAEKLRSQHCRPERAWGRAMASVGLAPPYLSVLRHSGGVTSCTHQPKEGGWRGNVSLASLPFLLA